MLPRGKAEVPLRIWTGWGCALPLSAVESTPTTTREPVSIGGRPRQMCRFPLGLPS